MKTSLALVATLLAALALAQDINSDRAALRVKERAAVEAARGDKSLTSKQKKAKVKEIHQDFRAQRKALREKYLSQRRAAPTAGRPSHKRHPSVAASALEIGRSFANIGM